MNLQNATHASQTRRRRWRPIGWLALIVLWLVVWLSKDTVFLSILRQQTSKLPDVEISVGGAHLGLFPGVVQLSDIQVTRAGERGRSGPAGNPLPLVHVEQAETRWAWRHLLSGTVTASANVSGVDVTIWRVPRPDSKTRKQDPGDPEVVPAPPEADTIIAVWPQISRFVVPISVDQVDAQNVRVWLRDVSVTPPLRFPIGGISAHAENLTNRKALSDGRYATVKVTAKPAKGTLQVAMQVDPMARLPTFSMNASLRDLDVPSVNDVLLAYANFDAESGKLSAQIDVACEQGKFRGSLEPRLAHFQVKPKASDEEKNSFANRAFRFLIHTASSLVQDKKEKTIATKVPLAGEFTDPAIGIGQAVLSLLGNAWWQSLAPSEGLPEGALPTLRGSLGPQGQSSKPGQPGKKEHKKDKKAGIK